MLRNYIRIAIRNFSRHTAYNTINLLGLAIGIASSLLILHYVRHERSYDDFHVDAEHIYRVRYDHFAEGEHVLKAASTFPRVGPAMMEEFPEVEAFARLYLRYGGGVVQVDDRSYKEDLIFQADPTFLTLFSYPMVQGDPQTALVEPNTAVISQETAQKYFGSRDPVGQSIRFGENERYVITGVVSSPENSHLRFNVLLSYATLVREWGEHFENAWGWYDFYTYVKLRPGTDPAVIDARFPAFAERYGGENASRYHQFSLQPLQQIHLHSNLVQEARVNGDATSIQILSIIALFVLAIAWVNYVNLSTARASERAREIGVRKVVGANRSQLIRQFLAESILFTLAAGVIALLLVELAMPFFIDLVGKDIPRSIMEDLRFWGLFFSFLLLGGMIGGLYPAFVLSSFRPILVLKNAPLRTLRGITLRKSLVVIQFAASVALISGTVIVYQQISYMRSQDLGFDIEQTLVVHGPDVVGSDSLYAGRAEAFKQELLRHPAVRAVAASTEIPGNLVYWTSGSRRLDVTPDLQTVLYMVGIDYDFIRAYEYQLLAGRDFSKTHLTDAGGILLNETAISVFGFEHAEEALDARILVGSPENGDTLRVLGVVADFHQEGLHKQVYPIGFRLNETARDYFSIKLSTNDLSETIDFAGRVYTSAFPTNPFNYFFLDEFFNDEYQAFQQFGRVFGLFSILAILIACLGLVGLSSLTASQRKKEIGIRKVMGSTVTGILVLLSKDFLRLVVLGGLIAVPLSLFFMNAWLTGFAFRMQLGATPFILAALVTVVVALLSVGYQSLRAARANPAHNLRYE